MRTVKTAVDQVELNVRIMMDNDPKKLSSFDIETQKDIMRSIGISYFTPMECFDEAFDFFRAIITEKGYHSDGSLKMIIKAQYFFAKAIYQSQFNKGVYDKHHMIQCYNKFFNEKTLADNLADFGKDGDLFWHWAVSLLTELGYKH